jgi:hypothetical protein
MATRAAKRARLVVERRPAAVPHDGRHDPHRRPFDASKRKYGKVDDELLQRLVEAALGEHLVEFFLGDARLDDGFFLRGATCFHHEMVDAVPHRADVDRLTQLRQRLCFDTDELANVLDDFVGNVGIRRWIEAPWPIRRQVHIAKQRAGTAAPHCGDAHERLRAAKLVDLREFGGVVDAVERLQRVHQAVRPPRSRVVAVVPHHLELPADIACEAAHIGDGRRFCCGLLGKVLLLHAVERAGRHNPERPKATSGTGNAAIAICGSIQY